MRTKFLLILIVSALTASAQIPEEALRLSWNPQAGSARNQAIGGAMASLGGDATANIVNPAGLAFFKTSDFVFTPGYQFGKNKNTFRSTLNTNKNEGKFNLGTSGWVFGGFGYKAKNSFAITVTKAADFNKTLSYKGQNDYSSFAEPLADEFASSGLTIDQALNSNDISLPTKMALYTYLVDTATIGGTKKVIARSENTSLLNQEHLTETSGGTTEITFGWGHELNKKLLLGASLGIPITKLNRDTYYRESDATNVINKFKYMAFRENYDLSGVGVNLKAGLIYRPKDYIRFGLALHSPSVMMLKEKYSAGFAADLENLFAQSYDSVASSTITGNASEIYKYNTYTPTKIIISGSYVFREVENVNKQKGFITADIEYTNYKWMKFGPDAGNGEITPEAKAAFNPFNEAIDAFYKSAFNFKIGGELKFKIIMARLGFAYYGNPYKDKANLKASKMNLSGGLGYRHKGMFLDLTYVHHINKDVNFPYRVNAPRANTFANLKETVGMAMLTVGFKI
jgi:hypothetical protein